MKQTYGADGGPLKQIQQVNNHVDPEKHLNDPPHGLLSNKEPHQHSQPVKGDLDSPLKDHHFQNDKGYSPHRKNAMIKADCLLLPEVRDRKSVV